MLLCIMLSTSVSTFANEYKSMIRYDRIWEHISIYWDDITIYHTKFDGQEEINGKTYHRLVTFRKARTLRDNDNQRYVSEVDEDYYKHEGYLREEDGKVYTLLSNYKEYDDDFYGRLYTPFDYETQPSDLEEKLIYDFTCQEWETYHGIHVIGDAENMDYKVKAVESVNVDGEDHRVLRVVPEGYDYVELKIVEGIGIDGEYGCLTAINFLYIPTCPCMDYIFNRVLSTEGDIIYRSEFDCLDLPYSDFSGVSSISNQSKTEDTKKYDMLGRRITTPAPGQLYIQDGKKIIAPK